MVPMVSSKQELQNIGENEGIVFGSFIVNVDNSVEKASVLSMHRGGRNAHAQVYKVLITENEFNEFNPRYVIMAKPEQEEIFIKKLPAGDYQIQNIESGGLYWYPHLKFRVTPKQTTYIGKLTMRLPGWASGGSLIHGTISDTQQKTIAQLKSEHEKSVAEAVKALNG